MRVYIFMKNRVGSVKPIYLVGLKVIRCLKVLILNCQKIK